MGWWFHIFTWLGNGCLTKHLFMKKKQLFGSSRVVILTEKKHLKTCGGRIEQIPKNYHTINVGICCLFDPFNTFLQILAHRTWAWFHGTQMDLWRFGDWTPQSSAKKYDHWCLGHGKHHHTHTGSLYVYLHWIYLYVCRLDPPQYTCINDPCLNPPLSAGRLQWYSGSATIAWRGRTA